MRPILLAAAVGLGLLLAAPGSALAEGTYYGMFYDSVLET